MEITYCKNAAFDTEPEKLCTYTMEIEISMQFT